MEERLYPALITEALRNVRYPGNGKDLVENNMVEDDIRIDGMNVSFSLIFDKSTDPFIKSVVKAAETAVKTYASENARIEGNISVKYRQNVEQPAKMLPGVKNIIGVSSGKGGVGKSTVASNLAVALAKQGYKVGLLDADIFGPSAPKMFGVEDAPVYMDEVGGRNLIAPVEQYGVKVLSIGFLVDKDKRRALARRHGKQRPEATHRRRQLGRPRLFCDRYAPRNERHPSDACADPCHHRSRSGHHSAGSGTCRRAQGRQHVPKPAGQRAGARHRGEYGMVHSGGTSG